MSGPLTAPAGLVSQLLIKMQTASVLGPSVAIQLDNAPLAIQTYLGCPQLC
jgi:hypothetical protein